MRASTSRRWMPSCAAWTSTAASAGGGTTTPATGSRPRSRRRASVSAATRAATTGRTTPAVRGAVVAGRDSSYGKNGVVLYDCEARKTVASWRDDKEATPIASSHALTKNHVVVTTLRGEVIVFALGAKEPGKPFRFRTP